MAGGFKFDLKLNERELKKMIQGAVQDVAAEYQQMLDSLLRRYEGSPVAEIKPVLRREWRRIGGDISDPELTEYATFISEGTRIQMRASH